MVAPKISPDLRRDLLSLAFEPLKLQCLEVVSQHLKIYGAVIASQDADESSYHIGEHG